MATTDDPREAIVGAWRLVHSVEYRPDGERRYPFGEDAVGYIMYSETGVMAVQIARRVRARDAEGRTDYLAYFGRYEVDTENRLVRHHLEGQLRPGDHPDLLERSYELYDDKLSIRPLDGTDREILWQRA
jgi:catechol 1,2-dioxygenase